MTTAGTRDRSKALYTMMPGTNGNTIRTRSDGTPRNAPAKTKKRTSIATTLKISVVTGDPVCRKT